AGVAVPENALGYLMRNTQWLVQALGVDAFRLDATKNMDPFVLNYFDRAVYRASQRTLLDGSQKNVFAWGEAYDSNKAYLQSLIRKDINPADPGRIGGNRDTLDFPLFFALKSNLSSNGLGNDWRNISGASLDYADDGLMNGSIGVKFAGSHDDGLCDLSNVSYAYTLMTPGNTIIYDNAKQFGNGRDFPKSGRADALGGAYGDSITKLVNIRNVYGQGNFIPRLLSKESYAFERNKQSITLLSNRSDNVYDNQTLQTNFAAGTYLVELTGNGAKYGAPQLLQVQSAGGQSYVNVSILPNNGGDHGYLVYGLQAPQGSLALGGVSQTIAGTPSPTLTGTSDQKSYQNATTRLSDLRVVTGNTFTATLNTTAVNLLGSIRDRDADGDNALVKLDGGLDVNGNGHVDFTTPGGVSYGFENFTGTKNTGYAAADGNGIYAQAINTSGLSEGYHYLTVRAFRHRDDGGPAVYSDFKETLYVDCLKPVSSVNKFVPFGTSAGDNDIWVKSDDQTATNVRVFLNLPATVTAAQIQAMVANGQGTTNQLDRDIFKTGFFGIPKGNNTVTIVSTEITGNQNIQRLAGQKPANGRGAGLVDLDHNGTVDANDIAGTSYGFEHVLYTRNAEFNPSADVNADGLVDNRDLFALGAATPLGATAAQAAIRQTILRRANINGQFGTDAYDIDAEYQRLGKTGDNWFEDLNVDGAVTQADVDVLVRTVFGTNYGDADLNGKVDFNDFLSIQNHFGQQGGWAFGDFTGDGKVDFNDFLQLQNNFGSGTTVTASEVAAMTAFARTVPEPATMGLAMLAIPLLARRTRRGISTKRLTPTCLFSGTYEEV
ncbi:MAG: hypothetical protein JWM57_4011, partial [Phycisphaerales bacterium]|nr:hypothetical protein [Phycisphaerales bacterium]